MLLALAGAAGCTGVKVASSWRDPALPGGIYRKTLIVAVAPTREERVALENGLSRELRRRVQAATSNLLLPGDAELDRMQIESAASSYRADCVLVVRLLPAVAPVPVRPDTPLYQHYRAAWRAGVRAPPRGVDGRTLTELRLFDVRTEALAWSATLEAGDFQADRDDTEAWAGKVASELTRSGLFRPWSD